MFLMHWVSMVPIVLMYTWLRQGSSSLLWYSAYLKSQDYRSIIGIPSLLLLTGTMGVIVAYILSTCRFHDWRLCVGRIDSTLADYGFENMSKAQIIMSAVYFCIMNPIIEELFWRVFMHREIDFFYESVEADVEQVTIIERSSSNTDNTSRRIPWPVLLLFSVLFSSYHTLVIGVFLGGVAYGILAFFIIGVLGLIFQQILLGSPQDKGFYRILFLHVGIDLGIILSLGDAIGWYNLI